jgi:hypothetical protein
MWMVFPSSDYYQDSVTLGLASFRRSWISPISYVLARFRSPTHPYTQAGLLGISSIGFTVPHARREVLDDIAINQCRNGGKDAPIRIRVQAV